MEWNISSNAPIYTQLVEQLTLRIVTTEYIPGQRLQSVRELAMEAGVNPNTMQRALSELEREGLVFSLRTSGRFVTEDTKMIEDAKKEIAAEQVQSFLAAMNRLGFEKEEIVSLVEAAQKKEEDMHGDS